MAQTVQTVAEWIDLTLASEDAVSAVDIVNQAGEFLANHHKWRWMTTRSAEITPRTDLSFPSSGAGVGAGIASGITSKNSNPGGHHITLEAVSAWEYDWVVGDKLKITGQNPEGGGEAILGEHKIVARLANDEIVVETSANKVAGTRFSRASAEITTDSVGLPADFASLVAIDGFNTNRRTIMPTTLDHIARLRVDETYSATDVYWGALNTAWHQRTQFNPTVSGAGGSGIIAAQPPTEILEIYPSTASENLVLFYRAGWSRVSTDNDSIIIPVWMEGCFIELVQHYAHGHLEKDEASLALRLREWEVSPQTAAAKRRDGGAQGNMGQMRGGAARPQHYGHDPADCDNISEVTF